MFIFKSIKEKTHLRIVVLLTIGLLFIYFYLLLTEFREGFKTVCQSIEKKLRDFSAKIIRKI